MCCWVCGPESLQKDRHTCSRREVASVRSAARPFLVVREGTRVSVTAAGRDRDVTAGAAGRLFVVFIVFHRNAEVNHRCR